MTNGEYITRIVEQEEDFCILTNDVDRTVTIEVSLDWWNKSKVESEKQMKNNKVYVLTADGWTQGWGSEIYLMGVFFDKKTAEREAEKQDTHVSITDIEANKIFPLKTNNFQEKTNAYYLGGYIE